MIKALWISSDENLHTITTNYETFTKIFVGKKQKKMVKAQRKWIVDCRVETQENIDWDSLPIIFPVHKNLKTLIVADLLNWLATLKDKLDQKT